jgi:hypothetical protein
MGIFPVMGLFYFRAGRDGIGRQTLSIVIVQNSKTMVVQHEKLIIQVKNAGAFWLRRVRGTFDLFFTGDFSVCR